MKVLQKAWPGNYEPGKPYEVEVEEDDDLVGVRCERNNCTTFKPGDRVLMVGRGIHTEHHTAAINAVTAMFKPKKEQK